MIIAAWFMFRGSQWDFKKKHPPPQQKDPTVMQHQLLLLRECCWFFFSSPLFFSGCHLIPVRIFLFVMAAQNKTQRDAAHSTVQYKTQDSKRFHWSHHRRVLPFLLATEPAIRMRKINVWTFWIFKVLNKNIGNKLFKVKLLHRGYLFFLIIFF